MSYWSLLIFVLQFCQIPSLFGQGVPIGEEFQINSHSQRTPEPDEPSGWVWQNPLPQGNTLSSIHVFNSESVILAGGAAILKSEDAGQSWNIDKNPAGISGAINAVYFVNDSTGWAAGNGGIKLKTVNGGKCWFSLDSIGIYTNWNSVYFNDERNGWMAGNHFELTLYGQIAKANVDRTTDGGYTWKGYPFPWQSSLSASRFNSIQFTSPKRGFAAGQFESRFFATEDGGETWMRQEIGLTTDLFALTFVDSTTGWAVGGAGTILRTVDGGTTWIRQATGTSKNLHAVHFVDRQHGWAAGDSGVVLNTADGGASWQMTDAGTKQQLLAVKFSDPSEGWATGAGGVILRTHDGGQSWTHFSQSFSDGLTAIHFVDSQTGWLIGTAGTIFKTTDGGLNWINQPTGTLISFSALSFLDSNTGWVAGQGGIVNTIDGGRNWHEIENFPHKNGKIRALQLLDENTAYLLGDDDRFHITNDGGATWRWEGIAIAGPRNNFHFLDSNTGLVLGHLASGETSIILRTTDAWQSWTEVYRGHGDVRQVFFLNDTLGWVVGSRTVLATHDGGITWKSRKAPPTWLQLRAVHFADHEFGWVVSDSGSIFFTSDGAETWQRLRSGTTNSLTSVFFNDLYTGWVVGEHGTLLKTTTGGIDVAVDTCTAPPKPPEPQPPPVPVTFRLYPNFPNPFRDETHFHFSLTDTANVSMEIYNVTGRLVRTLVNESRNGLQSGYLHYVTWDGRDENGQLAKTGVYFCRMQIGSVVQSRKLLILR